MKADPAWTMVRRLGLRLESEVLDDFTVELRLHSEVLGAVVVGRGAGYALACKALEESIRGHLLHPRPMGRRVDHFLKINAERAARVTCVFGHPYSIVGRQRRCLPCAAVRQQKYRERLRARKKANDGE
jgi:hypothetical protein